MSTISTDSYYTAESLLETLVSKHVDISTYGMYVNMDSFFYSADFDKSIDDPLLLNLLKAYKNLRSLVIKDIDHVIRTKYNNLFTNNSNIVGIDKINSLYYIVRKVYRINEEIRITGLSFGAEDEAGVEDIELYSLIYLLYILIILKE